MLTKDKVTHCRMDEASLFKFGKWDKDGRLHSLTEVKNFPWKERVLGHVMLLQILNPRSVFLEWMKLCTLFKFSKWIDCSKSHHRGEKFPLKGAWSGSCPWKGHGLGHVPERGMVWSCNPFKYFKSPSICLEWMKLHSLNLEIGLTMAPPWAKKTLP